MRIRIPAGKKDNIQAVLDSIPTKPLYTLFLGDFLGNKSSFLVVDKISSFTPSEHKEYTLSGFAYWNKYRSIKGLILKEKI